MPPPLPPPVGRAQADPYPWPPRHPAGYGGDSARRSSPDGWVKLLVPVAIAALATAVTAWSDQRTQATAIDSLRGQVAELKRQNEALERIHRVDISDVLKTVNATSVDVAAIKAVVVREPKRRVRRR